MKFGDVPVEQARGAILAHSVSCNGSRLRKGAILDDAHLAQLSAAGITTVTVARMEQGDVHEDAAALQLAQSICPNPASVNIRLSDAFTGRVNLIATTAGIVRLDRDKLIAMNAIDPMITVATVPDYQQVAEGSLIATIKIISYAVHQDQLSLACTRANATISLIAPQIKTADLILSDIGTSVTEKGVSAIEARLAALNVTLSETRIVPHETSAIADALGKSSAELSLILTGSATSDQEDVAPRALRQAGGQLIRFGMPVDPGNLLFHGTLEGRPVIGLPGCARAPALNGADWVMSRIICGITPTAQDFAEMSVGGLLKEIPTRPLPRRSIKNA